MDFQDSPVQSKGTDKAPKSGGASDGKGRNANIMPGGKVDPRSKLYQRSVAGRESLSDYLQKLWNDGTDEADVFMAGVKSLMSRGHGYVGAYLDSKNPGRVYKENEAMAITDAVMSKAGIGEHPGNRLTRAKDDEGKEERKVSNQLRGMTAPKLERGQKAMPVGQQRKQGIKRPTGPALPETKYTKDEEGKLLPKSQRDAIGKRGLGKPSPYQQPVAKPDGEGSVNVERRWQENLKKGLADIAKQESEGKITPEQAQSLVRELNKKQVQAGKEERERALKGAAAVERKRADQKRERQDTAATGGGTEDEKINVNDSIKKSLITPKLLNLFKGKVEKDSAGRELLDYIDDVSQGWEGDSEVLSNILDDLSNEISGTYKEQTGVDLNASSVKNSILDTIRGSKIISGKIGASLEGVQSAPEEQAPAQQPQPQQVAPQKSGGKSANLEGVADDFMRAFADYLADGDDYFTKKQINKYIKRVSEESGIKPQEIISAIRADERGDYVLKRYGIGASSLVRKGKREEQAAPEEQPQESAPQEQAAPGEQAPPEEQAAPAAPKRKPSRRGFGALVPKQPAPRGGGPITPSSKPNPEAVKEVMDVAKENPPLEDFKTFLYKKQGELFGGAGVETGSADTNPLEGGSTQPFPKGPEETAPASQLPGSGGPTPRSAARGQEGQQSLFKMKDGQETMEPRGDLKKGSKPKPTPKQPAPKKRTQAESQEIRSKGSEALADLQTRNKLAEDMTRRISNSPIAKDEEMRDWINNDLERLLKSFTPAEKTEDPWEQDGPEPSGIPEPEAPAQQPQRALPGQPGPRGLLTPGKEPAAPGGRAGRRTKPQGDEIRRKGQKTLEQLQGGQRTASRMQNSPVAQREDEVNRQGEELLRQIQNEGRKPAKPSGRRTKAQGDEIRRRGQQVLEEIQSDARKAGEVQGRMANSPAGTGEAPSNPREADITKRGEDVLRRMKADELMEQPGMTSRKAANILAKGGYSSRNPLDKAAGAVLDGMDRNDAAVSKAPKAVQRVAPRFNRKKKTTESAEYQEFAQSIRSLMR